MKFKASYNRCGWNRGLAFHYPNRSYPDSFRIPPTAKPPSSLKFEKVPLAHETGYAKNVALKGFMVSVDSAPTPYDSEKEWIMPSIPPISSCPMRALESQDKKSGKVSRRLRYGLFSVYNRLVSLVFIANLSIIILYITKLEQVQLSVLSTWASANFLLAILVRQDFFINLLFRTAWHVPWWMSLRIRRTVARVYTYGGIHSGAAAAGTAWWILYTSIMTATYSGQGLFYAAVIVLTWLVQALLILIILFACPHLRSKSHNAFEISHRYAGWSAIVLLWIQLLAQSYHEQQKSGEPQAHILGKAPTFWNLTAMTALLAQPWIRLRKWSFTPEHLSSHALRLHFKNHVHRFSVLSISTSPLCEWHPFATFPDPDGQGASMVISSAGDWTRQQIASPRCTYWVKGSPRPGVLSLTCIFKRVVIVTTGSGIGPCLSSLMDNPENQFCRLVWSTRTPVETFGKGIMEMVMTVDPEAVVIDSKVMGRPDLERVAYKEFLECGAEAVFVLSNREVTEKVVLGLECRGVPAFGPIWDS